MANVWGTFGRSNPSAANLTDAYTVPASTEFVGHVIVANRGTATSFRIAIAPNGAADDPTHYIAYDAPISDNDVYESPKFACDASDVVRVYATDATLTFAVTGVQKT